MNYHINDRESTRSSDKIADAIISKLFNLYQIVKIPSLVVFAICMSFSAATAEDSELHGYGEKLLRCYFPSEFAFGFEFRSAFDITDDTEQLDEEYPSWREEFPKVQSQHGAKSWRVIKVSWKSPYDRSVGFAQSKWASFIVLRGNPNFGVNKVYPLLIRSDVGGRKGRCWNRNGEWIAL
jgi:hypothetical protein